MVTSAARTLLLVHLGAGARNVRAALCLVRALLLLGKLPADDAGKNVFAGLETEDRVRERNLPCVFSLEGLDVDVPWSGSRTSRPT